MTGTPEFDLTPELMLAAYARGVFPMADSRDSAELHWIEPRLRGIFDLDRFHMSRSLCRRIRAARYEISVDRNFMGVVEACAARPETWINAPLLTVYEALHHRGRAHSLEVWESDSLVGGVFGLTIGRSFMGESMFSRQTDGSKIALAYLVDRLRRAGFRLFDTQFLTPHLASLGAIEIRQADYRRRLAEALEGDADFSLPTIPTPQELIQAIAQTSKRGSSSAESAGLEAIIQPSNKT